MDKVRLKFTEALYELVNANTGSKTVKETFIWAQKYIVDLAAVCMPYHNVKFENKPDSGQDPFDK